VRSALAVARTPAHIAKSRSTLFVQPVSFVVAANPARTFALVNLALFAVAIAAFLWLRHEGMFESMSAERSEAVEPSTTRVDSVALNPDDVQPAHEAQLAFINEILVDTTRSVTEGFVVAAQRAESFYLGAPVKRADTTSQIDVALWWVRGQREAPRSVKALNNAAEQYSLAGRVAPQDSVSSTDPEAQLLRQYLVAQTP